MAPELGRGESSYEGDVFAYGILIIQLGTKCELPVNQVSPLLQSTVAKFTS